MTRQFDRTTMKVGGKYHVWHTPKIWEATKNRPVIEIEIETLKHVDGVCWFDENFPPTIRNIVEHFVRMERVDTSYPIVLDPNGQLFDGAHRLAMALARGQNTIRAVQMTEVPPPDEIVDSIHD